MSTLWAFAGIPASFWSLPTLLPPVSSQRRITGGEKSIMVESPLSDMLSRIKNGYLARQKTVVIPHSKIKEELAKILLKAGYLAKVEIIKIASSAKKKAVETKVIKVALSYEGKKPVLEELKTISKPSLRVYVKKGKIPKVLGGRGLVILSTPQGLMTGKEAQKKGFGGEFICKVW